MHYVGVVPRHLLTGTDRDQVEHLQIPVSSAQFEGTETQSRGTDQSAAYLRSYMTRKTDDTFPESINLSCVCFIYSTAYELITVLKYYYCFVVSPSEVFYLLHCKPCNKK